MSAARIRDDLAEIVDGSDSNAARLHGGSSSPQRSPR
jgi:hypothetical protein